MRKLLPALAVLLCLNASAETADTINNGLSSRFLFFPFFLKSPETDWGFGGASAYFFKVKNEDTYSRTSDVNLVALYTLRQQVVVVLNSTIFFPDEKSIFRFQSSYSYYPDKFWGIGNNTLKEAEEDYSMKQFFFTPQILFKCIGRFYLGGSMELQNVSDFKYVTNGVFETGNVTGREGGFTSGLGALITYDSRNNAYYPDKGSFYELNATRFAKAIGSDFSFTSLTLDLRRFFKAGKNRVLGFHSLTRMNIGDAPIRYLSALGGTEIMRGYYKGRYSDNDIFAVQAELRQFLFWRIGVAAFGGLGQVGSNLDEFRLDDFHYSYGGGLRIMVQKKEKLNLRVDFGFGEHSHGVYVILKEAF